MRTSMKSLVVAAAAMSLIAAEPPRIRDQVRVRDDAPAPKGEPGSRQRKRWLQRQARKQSRLHRS